jgi:hypothetical protein
MRQPIIDYANTPRLSPAARERIQRSIRQRLVAALLSARPGVRLHTSAKHDLVAWMPGKRTFGFTLCSFDDYAWRISSRNASRCFGYVNQSPRDQWVSAQSPEHPFELSFLGADVPLVAVPELFQFVESMAKANHEVDVFKWDLFSHDENYPHYAWAEGSRSARFTPVTSES